MDALFDSGNPADAHIPGLLWAYKFSADGCGRQLGPDIAYDDLTTLDGWVWLHFSLADERARQFVLQLPGLPDAAKATLIDPDEHLCVALNDSTVHGIFSDLQRDLGGKTNDIGKLHFAINDHLVVSMRRVALHSVEETRRTIVRGKNIVTAVGLLEEIIQQFSTAVQTTLAGLSDDLDQIEDRVLDHGFSDERQKLVPARRLAAQLHRQLLALRSLFHRIEVMAHPKLPQGIALVAAHLSQGLDALDHEAINLQDRARLLYEEINSQITSETNDHLHLLSIITALLLPPTLVTGVFGMNAKGLFLSETEGGFYYALGICFMSIVLAYLVLRRFKIMK